MAKTADPIVMQPPPVQPLHQRPRLARGPSYDGTSGGSALCGGGSGAELCSKGDVFSLGEALRDVRSVLLQHEVLSAAFLLVKVAELAEKQGWVIPLTEWSGAVDTAAVEARLGCRCLATIQQALDKQKIGSRVRSEAVKLPTQPLQPPTSAAPGTARPNPFGRPDRPDSGRRIDERSHAGVTSPPTPQTPPGHDEEKLVLRPSDTGTCPVAARLDAKYKESSRLLMPPIDMRRPGGRSSGSAVQRHARSQDSTGTTSPESFAERFSAPLTGLREDSEVDDGQRRNNSWRTGMFASMVSKSRQERLREREENSWASELEDSLEKLTRNSFGSMVQGRPGDSMFDGEGESVKSNTSELRDTFNEECSDAE
eukprot:TRINITY_DN6122_c0_g1_i5.p1 TRINITY_DN6122_c0_g1~~TRINITY_DN6122_c0_g1_i5.p1  ORF type:complete len:369 (+),score=67.52 TRINITY_DN6122_c0_g1_i5:61-1167(+)